MSKTSNQNHCRALASLFLFLVLTSFFGCGRRTVDPSSITPQDTQAAAEQMEEQLGMKVVTVLMDLPQLGAWESEPLQKSLEGLVGDAGTESFFHFPEQAMSNHLFLPLDDYIENAEYIEWDNLQPQVMDAGRNDEGQQLFPLTYTFEATFFDSSYKPESQFPMTWDEMIEDPDPNIRAAACNARMENILGELADSDKDAPAFTEDELKRVSAKCYAVRGDLPDELKMNGQPPNLAMDLGDLSGISLVGEREYTIIPTYNLSGGITANITTFAAINRNARNPDEAFKIIDYLLFPRIQLTSPLFQSSMQGMPVYVPISFNDIPFTSKWRMNESLFNQINEAQKQINVVKFGGPLDECILNASAKKGDELAEKSGHEQYVLMQMLLAES